MDGGDGLDPDHHHGITTGPGGATLVVITLVMEVMEMVVMEMAVMEMAVAVLMVFQPSGRGVQGAQTSH